MFCSADFKAFQTLEDGSLASKLKVLNRQKNEVPYGSHEHTSSGPQDITR